MPYLENPKLVEEMSEESYALSMKKAKFEVEIELESGDNGNTCKSENKIRVFQ